MLSRTGRRRNLSPRCSGSGRGLHAPRRPAEGDNARGLGPGHRGRRSVPHDQAGLWFGKNAGLCPPRR